MTLSAAIESYLADCERRGLRKSTLGGKRQAFKALLANLGGDLPVAAVSRSDIRAFSESLKPRMKPGSAIAMLRHVRAMLRFCVSEEWLERSPMKGVAMPVDNRKPTQPLSVAEVRSLVNRSNGSGKALLLLLRYSGLAIGDAVVLPMSALRNGVIVTHRQKTGTLVSVPLPEAVVAELDRIQPASDAYWFWSGVSEPVTAAKTWRDRLKRVARDSGVKGFHPHRLRDTFAVELLMSGVAMEDVSRLLGHKSITITERYYAPWNRARIERLERIVRATHENDPLLSDAC